MNHHLRHPHPLIVALTLFGVTFGAVGATWTPGDTIGHDVGEATLTVWEQVQ